MSRTLDYHSRYLQLAILGIQGSDEATYQLAKGPHPELAHFVNAVGGDVFSREWLMNNGRPELLAMAAAVYNDEAAVEWLAKFQFERHYHIVRAALGNCSSRNWLRHHANRELLALAYAIYKDIEKHNDDPFDDVDTWDLH